MPPALIEVAFDPALHLGGLDIRWQTIGLTGVLLVALALAARIGSYLPPRLSIAEMVAGAAPLYPAAPAVGARPDGEVPAAQRLRLDDLAYILLGVVPGAVIGGRVAHGLVYWDAYAADPARLIDASVGSLSLLGAVLGGTMTGAYVARQLAAPLGRWADALAMPMLVAVGLGKLAQLLGGSGQGAAFDGGWAVSFIGPGPWHTLNPALPAHPAQAYEGLWALLGIPLLLRLVGAGPDLWRALPGWLAPRRARVRAAGTLFAVAIAWFLLGRVLIGFTWRDDIVVGPLNGEQALALGMLVVVLVGLAVRALFGLRRRRRGARPA